MFCKPLSTKDYLRTGVGKIFAHPPARLDDRAKVWPAKVLLKSSWVQDP